MSDATPSTQEQRENSGSGRGRVENLRPFQPGQTGNPGGRPKGKSITHRLAAILERRTIGGKRLPDGKCVADVLAEVIVKEALKGKFPFAKELWDRLEGKVPDRIIDETPDATAERDRAEFASILAALRERAGGRSTGPDVATPVLP